MDESKRKSVRSLHGHSPYLVMEQGTRGPCSVTLSVRAIARALQVRSVTDIHSWRSKAPPGSLAAGEPLEVQLYALWLRLCVLLVACAWEMGKAHGSIEGSRVWGPLCEAMSFARASSYMAGYARSVIQHAFLGNDVDVALCT